MRSGYILLVTAALACSGSVNGQIFPPPNSLEEYGYDPYYRDYMGADAGIDDDIDLHDYGYDYNRQGYGYDPYYGEYDSGYRDAPYGDYRYPDPYGVGPGDYGYDYNAIDF